MRGKSIWWPRVGWFGGVLGNARAHPISHRMYTCARCAARSINQRTTITTTLHCQNNTNKSLKFPDNHIHIQLARPPERNAASQCICMVMGDEERNPSRTSQQHPQPIPFERRRRARFDVSWCCARIYFYYRRALIRVYRKSADFAWIILLAMLAQVVCAVSRRTWVNISY